MPRLRVLTIVGTRPEIIKLSRVIAELDQHTDHVLVHTGQNYDYELNQVFFDELGIRKPDHFLNAAGETTAATIGNVITSADVILESEKPDAFLLLGDTNSCLSAIAAKRRHIPIFHMEAGNRCFDQRVPEEINRKIVDHISDINLTYTEHARRYLLAEGIRPESVIKTGSPMGEVLAHYKDGIAASKVLQRQGLEKGNYFVVSVHREENVDRSDRLEKLVDILKQIHERYGKPVIMSVHPRTAKRLSALPPTNNPDIRFLKPLGFLDYVHLQQHAFCVLSDSGTLTEESSILDFPGIMLRDAHERPEGMDVGSVIMAGLDPQNVMQAVDVLQAQQIAGKRATKIVPDYDIYDVSRKVVRIILSYCSYVNEFVWRK